MQHTSTFLFLSFSHTSVFLPQRLPTFNVCIAISYMSFSFENLYQHTASPFIQHSFSIQHTLAKFHHHTNQYFSTSKYHLCTYFGWSSSIPGFLAVSIFLRSTFSMTSSYHTSVTHMIPIVLFNDDFLHVIFPYSFSVFFTAT